MCSVQCPCIFLNPGQCTSCILPLPGCCILQIIWLDLLDLSICKILKWSWMQSFLCISTAQSSQSRDFVLCSVVMLCVWFSAHCVGKVVLWCTLYSVWLCALCIVQCTPGCVSMWCAVWWVLGGCTLGRVSYRREGRLSLPPPPHLFPHFTQIQTHIGFGNLATSDWVLFLLVLTGDQNVCQRKGRLLSFLHVNC